VKGEHKKKGYSATYIAVYPFVIIDAPGAIRTRDTSGLNNGVDNPRDQIVFHTLRHTYISWLVMMGTDIRTVQGMARHRSISMTMRYAHLAPDNISRAANRLPVFGPDGTVQ